MKWILFLSILFIILVPSALFLIQDQGSIVITWLGYEIRLSAIVGIGLLILLLISFVFLVSTLSWFFGTSFRWIASFGQANPKQQLLDLVTCYEAEIFPKALEYRQRIGKRLLNDPFFLWFSGLALEKSEKHLEAEMYFMDLVKNPKSAFLGLKGQIRSAFHRRDLQSAYGLLEYAKKLQPTSSWVLKHLLAVARDQKKFDEAEALVLRLEDLGYFTLEESKKQRAYLTYQHASQKNIKPHQREVLLKQSHDLDPSLDGATEDFASFLHDQGKVSQALQVLERTWRLNPTQKKGDLYLMISLPQTPLEAYQIAKKLVVHNPKSPESLLFLARTSLKANLWGEARAHLTELLKLKENVTALVYALFAKLELAEHKDTKAAITWLEEGIQAPRHT